VNVPTDHPYPNLSPSRGKESDLETTGLHVDELDKEESK
jgi:hypothetical protein